MKTFYALALFIAAAVVNASPVAQPAKLVAKSDDAEAAGQVRYIAYVVPSAEDEEQY
ncbi:hypothetical protein ACJ72_01151 [Emergomyces africanus]|uniref:Uncharacterized protein n=1 Tax=Emergomyces africanus TaxID=1955775 RepID=A0A1B7P625_9EURO|nr:hypothetical protein ACJ72_01151 [Emergomyces africanus]